MPVGAPWGIASGCCTPCVSIMMVLQGPCSKGGFPKALFISIQGANMLLVISCFAGSLVSVFQI